MQDYDENREVVRLRISGASETLQGYRYFWIRAVEEFDPKEHCAECLRGGWKLRGQNRMKLNQTVELRIKRVGGISVESRPAGTSTPSRSLIRFPRQEGRSRIPRTSTCRLRKRRGMSRR